MVAPLQWRTVSKDADLMTSRSRHLVPRGADTSLCGTTALPATLWTRLRAPRPACAECVASAARRGLQVPG